MTQSNIYNPLPANQIVRMELELTSICNLNCPLCMRGMMSLPPKGVIRDHGDVIAQLDGYPNLRYVTIAGAVSEPTSYPQLFDLIIYLNHRGIETSLYINGDTHTDSYYMKLGVLFRGGPSRVYFTICGSTQELHEQYRVGSNLERVLRRLDIVNRFSGNAGVLTWIIFNYNEEDFDLNYQALKQRYNTEFFYTLPFDEHFSKNQPIHLPERLREIYLTGVDRSDLTNICCPALDNQFVQIDYLGKVAPCTLHRLYGETRCFECSTKNKALLRRNKIFNIADSESAVSEIDLRLHYDNNPKI